MPASQMNRLPFIIPLLGLGIIGTRPVQAIPPVWDSRGPGGGGALYSPSINPYNPNEVFISCDMSDLFHTTNSGASWTTVDFRQLQAGRLSDVQFGAISNLAYTVQYPATGRTQPMRSLDGGGTWLPLPTNVWPPSRAAFGVLPSPLDPNTVLVGAQSNLYVSLDGGQTFTSKFFFAGGQAPAGQLAGLRLAGSFWDGSNIWVGANAGLLFSSDAGLSFTNAAVGGIPTNEVIFSFAGGRSGATLRFLCVTVPPRAAYLDNLISATYPQFRNAYALQWGQTNWAPATGGLATNTETYGLVAMARNDAFTAYLGGRGTNLYPFTRLYKTVNGGSNWTSVLTIATNRNILTAWAGHRVPSLYSTPVNMDVAEGLACNPLNASQVIWTDMGFAHGTTNGGGTWRQLYSDPAGQHPTNVLIAATNTYRGIGFEPTVGIWMHWTSPSNLLVGHSDIRLAHSPDAGLSWGFDYTGMTNDECYHIVEHPVSGALYADNTHVISPYSILGIDDASTDAARGVLMMSTNHGAAWSALHDFNGLPPVWETLDPRDPERLYVSVMNTTNGGVYLTTNVSSGASASWAHLPQPARANGRANNLRVLDDGTLVASYACLYRNSNAQFEASSGVFVTTNAGAAWDDRSDSNMVWWTQDVVIDPWDPGQSNWYACVWLAWTAPNAASRAGLYRTADRGRTWVHIWTNDGVRSCTFSPVNSNECYLAGHATGLWHSDDIRSAAPAFTQVPGYPFREPLRLFYNPHNSNEVWVLSNGNGARVGVYSNWTIRINAAGPGTNQPVAPARIYDGMPARLMFEAAPYAHIAALQTNGVDAGATGATAWTAAWDRVTADVTVDITYAEDLAAQGTPHAWLAQYGWTQNWDAAELTDTDGDGMPAWQEYRAGTDPSRAASVLAIRGAAPGSEGFTLRWASATGHTYAVRGAGDPAAGFVVDLATNLPATAPTNQFTDPAPPADRRFYRVDLQ